MKVYRISAITLKVKDMEKSCSLYARIPGFRLTYGGNPSDHFTTFEIGKGSMLTTYLNLERMEGEEENDGSDFKRSNAEKLNVKVNEDFGRIIFHVENVDGLYSFMKQDECISKSIVFENEPTNAPWGERFFHIREPNGYELSFAQPLSQVDQ
jgi:catechol 2,3-dioxygenase-like lactoylglutathione lyase family enzyme